MIGPVTLWSNSSRLAMNRTSRFDRWVATPPSTADNATVAAMAASLGGLDAVVFTGGVGENAEPVRRRILDHLAWLGLPQDKVFIIPANEEQTIAGHVAQLIGQ